MPENSHARRLADLIGRWEEAHDAGRPLSPEELCKDCPEHIAEIKDQIAALGRADRLLSTLDSHSAQPLKPDPEATAPGSSTIMHPWPVALTAEYGELRYITRGGMGELWEARDATLSRVVALKLLLARQQQNPDADRRFLIEAEITSRLDHPGVAPVLGVGHLRDGRPCYAMRFIHGETLDETIQRFHADSGEARQAFESLAFRQLLGRFVAVCNTIAYAHSRGIIHRDIKPQNIRLGKYGETVVLDWGLAKAVERGEDARASGEETLDPQTSSGATALGAAKGTPANMSPEQASGLGHLVGAASDIFSLGATLYALLTGRPPYRGKDALAALEQAVRGEFPAPRLAKKKAPRALEAICLKAMANRREDRYATATDLAADIERWLADEPVSAFREPMGARAWRWVRRHKPLVTAAGALLLTGLAALICIAVLLDQNRHALLEERELTAEQKRLADQASTELDAIDEAVNRMGLVRDAPFLSLANPEVYQRCLETHVRVLGEEHSRTLRCRDNLTLALMHGDQLSEARQVARTNLAIRERRLGPDAPATIENRALLGELLSPSAEPRDLAEAEGLRRSVLQSYERTLGPQDDVTLNAIEELAKLLMNQNKYTEAAALLAEYLERDRRRPAKSRTGSPHIAQMLGIVCEILHRLPEAEAAFRNSLESYHDHHRQLTSLKVWNDLIRVLVSQGKYEEAERMLKEAHANHLIVRQTPPRYDSLGETELELVRLYDTWNKPSEAGKWRARLPPKIRLRDGLIHQNAWPLLWGWPRF
jgi:pentatricopeptide repeat protein